MMRNHNDRLATMLLVFLLILILAGGALLALARCAMQDETIYLWEAGIMADCLGQWTWFGNESVGLHGFLFKIPAALLFLVVGKSVFAATMVNVLLTAGCCGLCFLFLRRLTASDGWALAGTWLLAANFQFWATAITFNRDIPVLFCMLLLFNAVLARWSPWVMGIVLLLILDAKEYVFFMILPWFGLWVLADEWRGRGFGEGTVYFKAAAIRLGAGLAPSVVLLMLMFFTSLVPLNMFAARALGLADGGFSNPAYGVFKVDAATKNPRDKGRELIRLEKSGTLNQFEQADMPQQDAESSLRSDQDSVGRESDHTFLQSVGQRVQSHGMIGLKYFEKFLYPSMFSFDGIPHVLAFPALAMSLLLMFGMGRDVNVGVCLLAVLTWMFLVVLTLLTTTNRYMMPIFPLLIGFLIIFLRDGMKRPVFSALILLGAAVFSMAGLYFSSEGLVLKVLVNAVLWSCLCAGWLAHRFNRRQAHVVLLGAVFFIGLITLFIFLRHNWHHPLGQGWNHARFGYNQEIEAILKELGDQERVWVNDLKWRDLPRFHANDRAESPEWEGSLNDWVPKKAMLNSYSDQRVYGFWWRGLEEFRERLRRHEIAVVGLVVSELPDERRFAPYEDFLEKFKEVDWLRQERSVVLKNKTLHVFRVLGEEGYYGISDYNKF